MTEEPQLGSIEQRIAALRQAQVAQPDVDPPFPRPGAERSKSANNPPSYNVTGSVLDSAAIGNEPAGDRPRRPVPQPPTKPEVKPKKAPPPVPTRRSERPPPPPLPPGRSAAPAASAEPAAPELPARPALPPRKPTGDSTRRPSIESITSDASHSTAATTAPSVGRGASTTSLNSNGNSRIKAPAWGTTELPALPPRRPKEDPADLKPIPRPESKSSSAVSGLTSKISALRGKKSSPSLSRPSESPRPAARDESPPPPRLPPRRPSGLDAQPNGRAEESPPSLPARRLPPPPSGRDLNDARQSGFGGLNKAPSLPLRPSSTPQTNGAPPPIPHSSRPNLAELQATKPRFHASVPSANSAAASSSTECLVCRDFSGPDQRAAQYPRESLPTHDMGWLANELTSPFPSWTDKARAIFTWIHHSIFYDTYSYFNNCVQPSTPAETLATGLAVCEGYAGLFAALATHAGLESIKISGHGKGFSHEPLAPGQPVPPFNGNHAWNAVKIDGGQWKLIDSCWGAGSIEGKGLPYKQHFSPEWFSMSNDDFGLKHFPSDKNHFFREDGRAGLSWDEYCITNPDNPTGRHPIKIYCGAESNSIGRRTLSPSDGQLSLYYTPSPVRFQFGLLCEHWTLAHHSRAKPGFFLLMIHGVDGRKDERLPFNRVPGRGPGGGGEMWYVDVPDARKLGAPGQKVLLAVLTKFGDREDCRGLTLREYEAEIGRVAMSWSYIAEWELVQ